MTHRCNGEAPLGLGAVVRSDGKMLPDEVPFCRRLVTACAATACWLAVVVAVAGCDYDSAANERASAAGGSDAGSPASIGDYVPDEREPPASDLDWERCSLVSGDTTREAECGRLPVPLDWSVLNGPVIDVFVKRYRLVGRPRGQLWLLNGGPGAAGSDFEPLLHYFLDENPDLEVYLLDHRGTGGSERLGCAGEDSLLEPGAAQASIVGECLAELNSAYPSGLAGFSTSGAARDLGTLIDHTRHADEPVLIYAISYGTLWAQRYMQLFPGQSSGLILDSICSPGECRFAARYDALFSEVGEVLLDHCRIDPSCASKLSGDPSASLKALMRSLDEGHCSDSALTRAKLRHVLAEMLRTVGLRELIPALIARAVRCAPDDVAAIGSALSVFGRPAVANPRGSQVLAINIIVSELLESPLPPLEDVEAGLEALGFSLDLGPAMVSLGRIWPKYHSDLVGLAWPTVELPMLMLSGGLDPQTPSVVGLPTVEHFVGPHQTLIEVPRAGHAVLLQSPIGEVLGTETCGARLVAQFLSSPDGAIDTLCVDQVAALDFSGERTVVSAVFGFDNAWFGQGQSRESYALRRLPETMARRRPNSVAYPLR